MRSFSKKEWYFLLKSIGCDEQLLSFPVTLDQNKILEEYVSIRDQWLKEELIDLDFDGTVHCLPTFAREIYNLTNIGSIFRWKKENTDIYIRGPVDVLLIQEQDDTITIQTIRNIEMVELFKDSLYTGPSGKIHTKRISDNLEAESDLTMYKAETDELAEVLAKHMNLLFEEWKDE